MFTTDCRLMFGCLTIAAVFGASSASVAAAPPRLNSLFPAGAQPGQTVTVTASGSFERWPVNAWAERPGVEITAAEEKGKLSIKVAADARPGVCWIRLYDDEGATPPRPFFIGTLPELNEVEPNDDWRKPQVLESSAVVVNGRLEKNGDVDTFAVRLTKGQTVVASMEANRTLGSAVDTSLQILSADGFVLDQSDDYHELDPQIVFTAPADGMYLVRTFGFPATPDSSIRFSGGADFVYRLTITTGGFVEYTMPLAVPRPPADATGEPLIVELFGWNLSEATKKLPLTLPTTGEFALVCHPELANTAAVQLVARASILEQEPTDAERPQEIALPATITGRIAPARDADWFRFQAKKGESLVFRVDSRSLGFPLDPVVRVTDSAGKTLAENDDSGGGRDAELAFSVPADGEYRVVVRDLHGHGGDRYVYRLSATQPVPDFALKVAADSFVLTPGKPLEIPVTVERSNGYAGEIEISVTGLPDGISAAPAKSLAQGDSSKSVKLTITSTAGPTAAPFRIVGAATGEPARSRAAVAPVASVNSITADLWLTVLKGQ